MHPEDGGVIWHRGSHLNPGENVHALLREDGDEPEVLLPGLQSTVQLSGTVLDEFRPSSRAMWFSASDVVESEVNVYSQKLNYVIFRSYKFYLRHILTKVNHLNISKLYRIWCHINTTQFACKTELATRKKIPP